MSYENFKKDAQYFARFLDTVGDGTGGLQCECSRYTGESC